MCLLVTLSDLIMPSAILHTQDLEDKKTAHWFMTCTPCQNMGLFTSYIKYTVIINVL